MLCEQGTTANEYLADVPFGHSKGHEICVDSYCIWRFHWLNSTHLRDQTFVSPTFSHSVLRRAGQV